MSGSINLKFGYIFTIRKDTVEFFQWHRVETKIWDKVFEWKRRKKIIPMSSVISGAHTIRKREFFNVLNPWRNLLEDFKGNTQKIYIYMKSMKVVIGREEDIELFCIHLLKS